MQELTCIYCCWTNNFSLASHHTINHTQLNATRTPADHRQWNWKSTTWNCPHTWLFSVIVPFTIFFEIVQRLSGRVTLFKYSTILHAYVPTKCEGKKYWLRLRFDWFQCFMFTAMILWHGIVCAAIWRPQQACSVPIDSLFVWFGWLCVSVWVSIVWVCCRCRFDKTIDTQSVFVHSGETYIQIKCDR